MSVEWWLSTRLSTSKKVTPALSDCMEAVARILLSGGAAGMARGAVPALALLPPTCKQAAAHAALVCVGASPTYFAPGWPWPLSWVGLC